MPNLFNRSANRHDHPTSPLAGNAGLQQIKRRKLNRLVYVIIGCVVVIGFAVAAMIWYRVALNPLDAHDSNRVRVTIQSGAQPASIAKELKDSKIIRSSYAFQIYTRLSGSENKLQAGTYAFAPNQSVSDIVSHLASGKTDEFSITILPGQTIFDIKTMLKGHGYSSDEIDAAMDAQYTGAVATSRGSQASLEGLFYPDTYNVLSDESLHSIFQRIFDHFDDVIAQNGLEAGFKANGLDLYQGITLSSIVQKEVSNADDQRKVASVFYNRLQSDISLGSDVTYIYGAELMGVQATPSLQSPYNLRINKNLTPTPISNPELSALQAVANPAKTDYLFFLSGDDGITYFAHTDAEHEANIAAHCKIKCQ